MIETLIVSPNHASPVEARATDPDDPGRDSGGWAAASYAWHQLGYWDLWQNERYDATRALTYSVVWACVSYISETVASLGWHQFERQGEKGRRQIPQEDIVSWMLGVQASPEMNSFEWRQVMLKDALLWGNGYSEIERDRMGRPVNFWRIDPGRVTLERDEDTDDLYYTIRNPHGGMGDTYLDPNNVFHLKGLSADGLVGYSVVEMARRAIDLGLQEERFGSQFFNRGPMPGGVLEIPGVMKQQERKEMRESFEKTYGGAANAGRVVVLSGGAKFNAMTIPNEDAQFIESRTFQADEIARWFRVPPHKVGLLSRSTFSNIEQQAIEAVQDCLLPWCRRLESEADVKLFGRNQMGRRYTRLNLDTLLRGDSQTQTTTVTTKVNNGLLTVNEGREYFDLNPIDGGDTPLVQGAMVPLERVLEEPEPAPSPGLPFGPPQPSTNGNGQQPEEMPAALRQVFNTLLFNAYKYLLKTEADKGKRTPEWKQSEAHVAGLLRPTVEAFLLASGRKCDAAKLSARLAAEHVAVSRTDPPREPTTPRAERQARAHLALLWNCGGPGSGVPGPCPEEGGGSKEKTTTGSEQLHTQAGQAAKTWGQWAKELPGKVVQAAKDKITTKYNQLKERYGKGLALAIMGAGIAATPIPVPGTTFVAVAPLIAAGELYRALRGGGGKKAAASALRNASDPAEDGLTDEEITQLGKEWMAEILKDWADNEGAQFEQEEEQSP